MPRVDDSDELSERLRNLSPDIKTQWGEAAVLSLALGQAVPLYSSATTRDKERSSEAAFRFFAEPKVRAEARRISTMAGLVEPTPFDAEEAEVEAWIERSRRRNTIISDEATRFAATHRFSYISPRGVTSFLKLLLDEWWGDLDGLLPPTKKIPALVDTPSIYVNPLADRELSVPVPPGHIAVVLAHATGESLGDLAQPLTDVQEQLGHNPDWRRGGKRQDRDEQMIFVHQLRTAQTGRGKRLMTWDQIRRRYVERFDDDVSETTLKQRYATWKRNTVIELRNPSAIPMREICSDNS